MKLYGFSALGAILALMGWATVGNLSGGNDTNHGMGQPLGCVSGEVTEGC